MSNFVYNEAKRAFGAAEIDLSAPPDLRVLLVMTNTTADTEDDVNVISGFSTLDELDDGSYARQSLTGDAFAEDATNNRAEYDATDTEFTYAGDGTRDTQAAIVFLFDTDDDSSVPIAFIDTGGFPIDSAQVGTVTLTWNAEGILQIT